MKEESEVTPAPTYSIPIPYHTNPTNEACITTNEASGKATSTCYVIGDRTAVIQDVLVRHGGTISQAHGWQVFKGRRCATLRQLHSSIVVDKPAVLWVHVDSGKADAQNKLTQQSARHIAKLISLQAEGGRQVIIEGSWSEVNWTSMSKMLLGNDARDRVS